MRRIAGVGCVVALLGVVAPARAEDDAALRAVVDKAIKAHGGADNLKKLQATVAKSKGKVHILGDVHEYTGETSVQLPNRSRLEIEATNFKFVRVLDGDKGWFKIGENTQEMPKEQLDEAKEEMNVATITHLVALQGKEYKLSSLGDLKVGDRQTVGVRVEREGRRAVGLFFDKDSGLLVKTERRGKDAMSGEEFTAETLYDDFKKVQGMTIAHKVTIKRDSKPFVESEMTEVKLSEKLDDSVFEKP